MGSKTTFEVKETWGTLKPPRAPQKFPWDVSSVIGVSYPCNPPTRLLPSPEAYALAVAARYWSWDRGRRAWDEIGAAHEFLLWLQSFTVRAGYEDWAISWPDPFDGAYTFACPENIQILPWRELIRRHFDQRAYISDYDMFIDDIYRRPVEPLGGGKEIFPSIVFSGEPE